MVSPLYFPHNYPSLKPCIYSLKHSLNVSRSLSVTCIPLPPSPHTPLSLYSLFFIPWLSLEWHLWFSWIIIVLCSLGKWNDMSGKRVFRDCKLIHVKFHCLLWNQALSLLKQGHNAWKTHKNVAKVKEHKKRSSFFKPRSKTSNTDSAQQALNGPGST